MSKNIGTFHPLFSELLEILPKQLKSHVKSIILFGSAVDKKFQVESISDLDYIVITSNEISKENFDILKKVILHLEWKYFSKHTQNINSFFRALQKSTGMFISGFICTESDLISQEFSRIFNTSRFISKFIAPQSSVWFSLLKKYTVVYGKDYLSSVATVELNKIDIIRSLLMNLLLSLGGLFLYPFTKSSFRFLTEAVKWSNFTYINYCERYKNVLDKHLFRKINRFQIMYRKNRYISPTFPILVPFYVYAIHNRIRKNLKKRSKV